MISWSYRRPVKFDDLVSFIDRKARIATNPVFGQITESSKILEARSIRGTVQKLLLKSRELSLAAQVNTDHGLDTEVNRSIITLALLNMRLPLCLSATPAAFATLTTPLRIADRSGAALTRSVFSL